MSGIVIASATAALTTAATVIVATLPEAQQLLAPFTETANEYVVVSASLLASIPTLVVLSMLALSGRD